jgi:hypothetical protein
MMGKEGTLEWLQRRIEEYRSLQNDTAEVVKDLRYIGKLGSGFAPVDELVKVDISCRE